MATKNKRVSVGKHELQETAEWSRTSPCGKGCWAWTRAQEGVEELAAAACRLAPSSRGVLAAGAAM